MPSAGESARRIGTAVLALFALACGGSPSAASGIKALRPLVVKGEKAPAFTVHTLEGKPLPFRPGGGKPALIVFWSAFCPLCRELAPGVRDVVRRHEASIRFLAVNLDGPRFRNAVRSFVTEYRWSVPVGLDDIRDDFFIASDPYGIVKTPTAVLVDGSGRIWGAYPAEEMRALLADFDRISLEIQKGTNVGEKSVDRGPSG